MSNMPLTLRMVGTWSVIPFSARYTEWWTRVARGRLRALNWDLRDEIYALILEAARPLNCNNSMNANTVLYDTSTISTHINCINCRKEVRWAICALMVLG